MRMYRPLPVTLKVWLPPVPVVVEKMLVHVVLSVEVWIWNALPYAVSQFRVTWQMAWDEPRSTSSHCGSEKALDQRVPVLPSTASAAGVAALSVEAAGGGSFEGYESPLVPLDVRARPTSGQPPWFRSVRSESGDHCWPALPLQPVTP